MKKNPYCSTVNVLSRSITPMSIIEDQPASSTPGGSRRLVSDVDMGEREWVVDVFCLGRVSNVGDVGFASICALPAMKIILELAVVDFKMTAQRDNG